MRCYRAHVVEGGARVSTDPRSSHVVAFVSCCFVRRRLLMRTKPKPKQQPPPQPARAKDDPLWCQWTSASHAPCHKVSEPGLPFCMYHCAATFGIALGASAVSLLDRAVSLRLAVRPRPRGNRAVDARRLAPAQASRPRTRPAARSATPSTSGCSQAGSCARRSCATSSPIPVTSDQVEYVKENARVAAAAPVAEASATTGSTGTRPE